MPRVFYVLVVADAGALEEDSRGAGVAARSARLDLDLVLLHRSN